MNTKLRRVIAFILMLIMLSGVVGPENLMMLAAYAEEVKPESTETSEPVAAGGDDAAETEVKDEEPTASQTAEPTEDPMPAASQPETGEEANEPTREDSSDSPQTESKADESEAAYTTKPVELMKDMALTLSGDLPEGAVIGFEETEYEFDESKGSLLFAAKLIVSDAAGESLKCEGSVTATLKGEAVRELLEADEVFSLIVNARGSEAKHLKAKDDTVSFRLTRFDLFILYLEGEEETIEIPAQEPVDEPSADVITADGEDEITANGEDEITADGEDEITADGEDATAALTEEAATSVSDESEPSEQSLELSALTGELSPAATEGLDTSLASAPVSVTQSAAVAATASYRMEQETVYLKDILSALNMSVKNNTKLSVTPAGLVTLSADTYKNKNKDSITLTASTYFDEATLTIGSETVTLSYPAPDELELIDYTAVSPLKPEAPADAIWANDVLYLTGKMPANAVVDCVPVEIEIDGEYVIAAYDIKIYANANQKAKGKQWQPNGNKVQVHFFAAESEDAVHVYHMADGTTTAQLVDTVTPNDGWVAFDAEHFSTYGFSFFEDLLKQTLDAALNKLLYKDTVFENDEIILTGNLPRNAIIEAKKVDVEIEGQDSILAYDIKIYQNSFFKLLGIVWQPKEGNPISVKVKSDAFAGRENVSIYHMADENAEPEFVTSVSVEDESVVFTAESFSIYPITDQETPPRVFYSFINGNTVLTTEYITKIDEFYDPGVTPEYGQTFLGWAYDAAETNESNILSWDQLKADLQTTLSGSFNDGDEIKVYAKFKEAYYLRYMVMDGEGNVGVLKSDSIRVDAADKTVTVNCEYSGDGEHFQGWIDATSGTVPYLNGDTITLDHHIDLYAKIAGRYWLVFNANIKGATFTGPQLIFGEYTTHKPDDPTKKGYNFKGWNTAPDGSGTWWYKADDASVNLFGGQITADTTLYAQWEGAPNSYTVIYWKQKAGVGPDDQTRDDYEYVESQTVTGVHTGDVISALPAGYNTKATTTNPASSYYQTEYGRTDWTSEKTVSARYNGVTQEDFIELAGFERLGSDSGRDSSEFYIYNTSQNGTINFYYTRKVHNIDFHSWGENVTANSIQTVTNVPYEAKIKNYLPTDPTNGKEGYYFAGWYQDQECLLPITDDMTMPDGNAVFYAKWDTFRVRVVLVPNCTDFWFANNQSVTFRLDYGESVSFGNIKPGVAKRPGYRLTGWYYTPDFQPGTEINTNEDYPITINTDGINMDYQNTADWRNNTYGDHDGKHDNVKGILKLYARWQLDLKEGTIYFIYEVEDSYCIYDSSGNLQTVIPVDSTGHAKETTFQIAEAPTGYIAGVEFTNWMVLNKSGGATSITYNAGDTVTLVESEWRDYINTTTVTDDDGNVGTMHFVYLRARFTKEEDKATTIIFHGNGGAMEGGTTDYTQVVPMNATIDLTVQTAAFTRAHYTLVSWSTKSDGTGTSFPVDEKLYANNEGLSEGEANELFAIWQTDIEIVAAGTTEEAIYDGLSHSNNVYEFSYLIGGEPITLQQLNDMGIQVNIASSGWPAAIGTEKGSYTAVNLSGTQLASLIQINDSVYRANGGQLNIKRVFEPTKLIIRDLILTIKKTVTGDFGDPTNPFTFTLVSVEGMSSGSFKGTIYHKIENTTRDTTFTIGGTFWMRDGDVVKIEGLPKGKLVTFQEDSGFYITSWQLDSQAATMGSSKTVTLTDDAELIVINDCKAPAPTGINSDTKPFGTLFLFGGLFAILSLFLVKRRKRWMEDDESDPDGGQGRAIAPPPSGGALPGERAIAPPGVAASPQGEDKTAKGLSPQAAEQTAPISEAPKKAGTASSSLGRGAAAREIGRRAREKILSQVILTRIRGWPATRGDPAPIPRGRSGTNRLLREGG